MQDRLPLFCERRVFRNVFSKSTLVFLSCQLLRRIPAMIEGEGARSAQPIGKSGGYACNKDQNIRRSSCGRKSNGFFPQ